MANGPLVAADARTPTSTIEGLRPRKPIPADLLAQRIDHAARALSGVGDHLGPFAERRTFLRNLVDSEDPESDTVLQVLLAKEIAFANFQEFLRRSSDFTLDAAVQAAFLTTAMKFSKLHLQYQAEYEKTQRKGIQHIVLQNNAPVRSQTIFGDAGAEAPPRTIDTTANPAPSPVRKRTRSVVRP